MLLMLMAVDSAVVCMGAVVVIWVSECVIE